MLLKRFLISYSQYPDMHSSQFTSVVVIWAEQIDHHVWRKNQR